MQGADERIDRPGTSEAGDEAMASDPTRVSIDVATEVAPLLGSPTEALQAYSLLAYSLQSCPAHSDTTRSDTVLPDIRPAVVELPARAPVFTRADAVSLALAAALHIAVLASMMTTDDRIGASGREPDAIGVDIVILAAALEGRTSATPELRGAFGSRPSPIAAAAGTQEPTEDQAATAAMTRTESAAAPPASAAPETEPSVEPPLPGLTIRPAVPEDDPLAPAFAIREGGGGDPGIAALLRPTDTAPTTAPLDSAAMQPSEARREGAVETGAGRTVDSTAAALALSRAGRRDRYGAAVFAALNRNLPAHIAGIAARVTVQFTVGVDGRAADVRIAASSGVPAVDAAALAAVQSTRFPLPPANVPPDQLVYSVPYTFTHEHKADDATVPTRP